MNNRTYRYPLYRTFGQLNRQEEGRYRGALIKMIDDLHPHAFMTLNFNTTLDLFSARRHLKKFAAQIDRRALGCRYNTKASKYRLMFVAVPEHLDANFHYHLAAVLPADMADLSDGRLFRRFSRMWRSHVPGGTIHFERYRDGGAADYMTKEIRIGGVIDHYILATEFHAHRPKRGR